MSRFSLAALTLAFFSIGLGSTLRAQGAEPVDKEANAIIRKQGLESSQVMDHLSWICDVYGPRLTGSPNLRRASAWAEKTLGSWGLQNVHRESWGPFGRGWRLESFSVRVTGENPWPVHAYPKAWTPSLPGKLSAEVVSLEGLNREQVEALDLTGKIVLLQSPRPISEPFEAQAHRLDAEELLAKANGTRIRRVRDIPRAGRSVKSFLRRGTLLRIVTKKKPLALLDRSSKGDYGTIFLSSASVASAADLPWGKRPRPWHKGAEVIPQFTLAVEHYNRICRLLKKKQKVQMELALQTSFYDDDPMQYNLIAEIPGQDPEIRDEVVMLGAHFDSWHSATGATDNGCGSAVMMEAVRILTQLIKERGQGPRRTIRIALWTGEEQGLLGSRAYVKEHFAEPGARGKAARSLKPAHAKLAGYFNLDNGTGRVRGVYLQKNAAVAPIFRAWLKPFNDLDAATLTLGNTGGTDHIAFDRVGLPGFQFIQDPIAYSPRTHHSNMDSWDHAVAADLKQASTVIASFVWHCAQRDQKLPRKPFPLRR